MPYKPRVWPHTGEKVYMTLHPAAPDTGVVFRRTDLDPVVEIPAGQQCWRYHAFNNVD